MIIFASVLILKQAYEGIRSKKDTLSYDIQTQKDELYMMFFDSTTSDAIYHKIIASNVASRFYQWKPVRTICNFRRSTHKIPTTKV